MVVRSQAEKGGELWLEVETIASEVGCGECGTRATGHGRRRVLARDLPVPGRPVVLEWVKRPWRCRERSCPTVTWTETHPRSSCAGR